MKSRVVSRRATMRTAIGVALAAFTLSAVASGLPQKGGKKKHDDEERGPGRTTGQVIAATPDGVPLVADEYFRYEKGTVPLIVLLHDASGSRIDFRRIAPRLTRMGFNCIAFDLRAGGGKQSRNMTAKMAPSKTAALSIADAEIDVITALEHVRRGKMGTRYVVLGTAYSGALAIRVAGTRPGLVDGVLAFSPEEYFGPAGKSDTWVQEEAGKVRCPVWITSGRKEMDRWKAIHDAIPEEWRSSFVPETNGLRGVAALVEENDAQDAYWNAMQSFLREHFLPEGSPDAPGSKDASDEGEDERARDEGAGGDDAGGDDGDDSGSDG